MLHMRGTSTANLVNKITWAELWTVPNPGNYPGEDEEKGNSTIPWMVGSFAIQARCVKSDASYTTEYRRSIDLMIPTSRVMCLRNEIPIWEILNTPLLTWC